MTAPALLSFAQLIEQLNAPRTGTGSTHRGATHASGSALALFCHHWVKRSPRPLVLLTDTGTRAQLAQAEIECLMPRDADGHRNTRSCILLETPSNSVYADVIPDRRLQQRRLATQLQLAASHREGAEVPRWSVAVLPAPALLQKVVPTAHLRDRSDSLSAGQLLCRDTLSRRLDRGGYLRVPLVEDPGTFAVRGGLLDVWPPGSELPLRLELVGDMLESIQSFNPEAQRRIETHAKVFLPPARAWEVPDAEAKQRLRDRCDACDWPSAKTRQLIDDLVEGRRLFGTDALLPAFGQLVDITDTIPKDALVVLDDPARIAVALQDAYARAEHEEAARRGTPYYPIDALYSDPNDIAEWLSQRETLSMTSAPIVGEDPDSIASFGRTTVDTPSLGSSDHSHLLSHLAAQRKSQGQTATLEPLLDAIRDWQARGLRVIITARSATKADRLSVLLNNRLHAGHTLRTDSSSDLTTALSAGPASEDSPVSIVVSPLPRGVVAEHDGIVLLTDNEFFGGETPRRQTRRRRNKEQTFADDLRSLRERDIVVHAEHGIGRYLGLVHRQFQDRTVDMMCVEYHGGDKLYLPVYRLNQLQKMRGSDAKPKLDRLGGQSFARAKGRARSKARDIADELMRLYAERQLAVGIPAPARDADFLTFEAAFPYEETEDQLRCLEEVSADLESPRPMDRLVCGDVGFGKTEIALRAAFRVAMSGRQVALLCPTTVLAQQHSLTFAKRLAPYPFNLAQLSRFQTKKEQDATTRGLRDGSVDIVIGTHRLLSKDVHFKALGLLVVDEEQRFGVTAKERLKALKKNVDALTLTATPIPRTLQMSVAGLRDLSLITTPPQDRRAVRTIVTRQDPSVVTEAITRELARGGQVYFVYNRISGLAERAAMIKQLVPHAQVRVAHGQMNEQRLESTMRDFINGDFDVLCSTAIVENGLDIPRCNTIIIDRAEMFGLAQLYQLRGRVGRSPERAYCYLIVPPAAALSAEARTRVETIQRYTDLGSGFQIASLDLELRGAGNLLGAEQSGAVATVGFDLFCRMLDEAVHELRGEPFVHDIDPELSFDVEALLPETYIADMGIRLSIYKRLSGAFDTAAVDAIGAELEDRFGRAPDPAARLLHLMALKTELRQLRVLGCEASSRKVVLHLNQDAPFDGTVLAAHVSRHPKSLRLTPDMRLTRRFDAADGMADGLAATQRLLHELASCVQS